MSDTVIILVLAGMILLDAAFIFFGVTKAVLTVAQRYESQAANYRCAACGVGSGEQADP